MRKLFRVSIFGKNYNITSFYHAKLIPGYYFMKNNPEFYRVSLTRSRVIKKNVFDTSFYFLPYIHLQILIVSINFHIFPVLWTIFRERIIIEVCIGIRERKIRSSWQMSLSFSWCVRWQKSCKLRWQICSWNSS